MNFLQYGWAISQKMPIGGFRWDYGVTVQDIINFNMNDDIGYFVEIDCYTPESIQDFVDEFLLFPNSLEISEDMASQFNAMARERVYGMVADTDAPSEN